MRITFCSSLLCFLILAGCSGKRPGKLGVSNGILTPCPKSPNCVSSQATDEKHRIEPLKYTGSRKNSKDKLLQVIRSIKRGKVVTEEKKYIHVEFRSALWRFTDDVEFYFDDNSKTIQVRSAARLGSYDLGVNRKRIERIRKEYKKLREGK